MRAIIVDDEQPSIDILKVHLAEEGSVEVVGSYRRPKDALTDVAGLKPDVAFLDVHMPLINGLDLAEMLTEQCEDLEIIFITAYEQYALAAFRHNAIDYLLKPITSEAVAGTVRRLRKRKRAVPSPAKPKAVAAVKCFGEFSVFGASGTRIGWRTSKAEELMAYLLLKGGNPISKWDIIGDLWPESSTDEQAHSHLHTTLYKVKKTLKEHGVDAPITYSMRKYHVNLGGLRLDMADFERCALRDEAVTPDNERSCREALELYAGDLFGDLDYSWSVMDKEKLRHYFCRMSHRLSRYLFDRGLLADAAETMHRLLAVSPYDEEAHELLLRVYAEQQDRVAFVRHYNKMRDMLHSELGLMPKPMIRHAYENMLYRPDGQGVGE